MKPRIEVADTPFVTRHRYALETDDDADSEEEFVDVKQYIDDEAEEDNTYASSWESDMEYSEDDDAEGEAELESESVGGESDEDQLYGL